MPSKVPLPRRDQAKINLRSATSGPVAKLLIAVFALVVPIWIATEFIMIGHISSDETAFSIE